MIVLSVVNCPPGLRGDLSKWLNEINAGVYVGRVSARVREELWARVCANMKNGQATMVYSTNNEQGYAFLVHNAVWKPVDFEGIILMQKPLEQPEPAEGDGMLRLGFSKAAKYRKASRMKSGKTAAGYVVVDVKTTGIDIDVDRIIEVGLLEIEGDGVGAQFQCFLKSGKGIADDEAGQVMGITNDMVEEEGLEEEEAFDKICAFIGEHLVVGFDVRFHVGFIERLGKRLGKEFEVKRTKDVLDMARRELDELEDYKLETVAGDFSLECGRVRRALPDCVLTYGIYCELNKL